MEKEKKNYARDYSHIHCWNQGNSPACGQTLESHKQCCLCDTASPNPAIALCATHGEDSRHCPCSAPPLPEAWEREFNEKFYFVASSDNGKKRIEIYEDSQKFANPKMPEILKSFIRQIDHSARIEERAKRNVEIAELISRYFMNSADLKTMDILEEIQRKILSDDELLSKI